MYFVTKRIKIKSHRYIKMLLFHGYSIYEWKMKEIVIDKCLCNPEIQQRIMYIFIVM